MFDTFDYETYCRLLGILKKTHTNYRFIDTRNTTHEKYFILRHDVDFSPDAAFKMAQIEREMGIKATYFLLFNSDFYNLLSHEFCHLPRKIVELGHEVGLHYDFSKYEEIGCNIHDILNFQARLLSAMAGTAIHSISMHNPSINGLDPFLKNREYINVYDSKFTKEIGYFSDSGGAWRKTTIESFKNNNIPKKMQLLIHPIYWNNSHADRWDRMQLLIESRIKKIKNQQISVFKLWQQHNGVKEYDKMRMDDKMHPLFFSSDTKKTR